METNPEIEKAVKNREELQEKIHLLKTELYKKEKLLLELEGALKFANFQLQHWDKFKKENNGK